jgi:allantoinase
MPEFDLLIRGAEPFPEIGIANGKIAALHGGAAREEVDATGLHLFPGVIDAHVHFNEPGREEWEGLETGSRAFAAGGGTLFFDMPLNAHPPTIDKESFDLKLAAAQEKSVTDFALWGGLVPQNAGRLDELAARGVMGFKAFMCNSGIEDFPAVDDVTLREGMKNAAQLKLPVAVHAESESLTKSLTQKKMAEGQTTIRDYLDSRPTAAELDAIRRALDVAGETGCALHVVHVSSGEGIALIAEAKRRGVDVSCETCPHYLMLSEGDMEKLGAVAKCAPPLRSMTGQQQLWQRVLAGEVTTVGSDHSPSPPGLKLDKDFFKVWGGISSVQHTLSLLLSRLHGDESARNGKVLSLITHLLSTNVASRFKLPAKGRIAAGYDADFALVDLSRDFQVRAEDLLYRHRQSPYVGRTLRGKVVRTILRGRTIFLNDKIVAKPAGGLVKPAS